MPHNTLWGGKRGVSPVVGVILMVAIVVVLAAVIAAFVLGFGNVETAPNAQFTFEIHEKSGQPDELEVIHETGDSVTNTKLYFIIEDETVQDEDGSPAGDRLSWYTVAADGGEYTTSMTEGESVSVGDSAAIEVAGGGTPTLDDKVVRLVWDGRGNSATLWTWCGPEATCP